MTLRGRIRYDWPVRPLVLAGAVLLSLSPLAGCSRPAVSVQRQPDGTRELKCELPLWQCVRAVDDYCKGNSFEVLYAVDKQELLGSQQSMVESHTSEALIRCQGQHVRLTGPIAAPPAALPASVPPPKGPPRPALACVPGSTQTCVGPGACNGGQACLADGSGFGACDCGTSTPPAATPPAPATAPPAAKP